MTKETMHKILDLHDRVMQDEEYMRLHKVYAPAEKAFGDLLRRLPPEEERIIGNYLLTAVELYHRILDIAFTMQENG